MTIQNQGRSNNLRVERTNSRWFQLFEYKNNKFVNEKGKVVEIAGGVDRENANIQVFKDLGSSKINQLWDLIYVDEMPKEPVKGELSPKFGLIVETPFYIQSNHGQNRYVDLPATNLPQMVLKAKNGRKSQLWWFDQKTRTVRNEQFRHLTFSIANNGRTVKLVK